MWRRLTGPSPSGTDERCPPLDLIRRLFLASAVLVAVAAVGAPVQGGVTSGPPDRDLLKTRLDAARGRPVSYASTHISETEELPVIPNTSAEVHMLCFPFCHSPLCIWPGSRPARKLRNLC